MARAVTGDRVARGDALGEHEDVGGGVGLVARPPRARAPHTALHLISDEQDVVPGPKRDKAPGRIKTRRFAVARMPKRSIRRRVHSAKNNVHAGYQSQHDVVVSCACGHSTAVLWRCRAVALLRCRAVVRACRTCRRRRATPSCSPAAARRSRPRPGWARSTRPPARTRGHEEARTRGREDARRTRGKAAVSHGHGESRVRCACVCVV